MTAADIHETYSSVHTGCGTQCMRCQAVMQQDEQFTYTNADVLFGGIVDIYGSSGVIYIENQIACQMMPECVCVK